MPFTMITPVQGDTLTYYTMGWYNCTLHGDMNTLVNEFLNDGTVLIEVNPFTSISNPDMNQTSLGIGVLMIHLNRSLAPPPTGEWSVTMNNEDALDMLINVTYVDGYYQGYPSAPIYETKYFLAYFYLFANHSVYNPSTIEINVGANHTREPEPQYFSLADDGAEEYDVELKIEPIYNTDPTEPTIPTVPPPTDIALPLTILVVGILVVLVLMFSDEIRNRLG